MPPPDIDTSTLPPNPELASLLDAVGRHLVVVYIELEKLGCPPFRLGLSAFLVTLDDEWLVVTAGHAVKDVTDILGQGYSITGEWLLDGWRGAQWKQSDTGFIPFSWKASAPWFVYERGLDYGALRLGYIERKNLEANGKKPLIEGNWNVPIESKFGAYVMAGVPLSETEVGKHALRTRHCAWTISRLDDAPDWYIGDPPAVPTFWGHVLGEGSIKGMSGGPIFGIAIKPPDRGHYYLMAMQSGWWEGERVIRAPSTAPLAKLLRENVLTPRSAAG